MLISEYANSLCIKWYKVICYNKIDGMENAIVFSDTLLDLELAEIGTYVPCPVKVGYPTYSQM